MGSATRTLYVRGYPPIRSPGSVPAGGGSARYPQASAPPGAPQFWFDAQDINLLGNAGIANLDPIGTWKNKGSLGASGDIVQGVAGQRPKFSLVASAPKINSLSAVRFTAAGSTFLTSASVASMPQPNLVAIIVRRSASADGVWFDGLTGHRHQIWYDSVANKFSLFAGTVVNANVGPTLNGYDLVVATFNGASTALRVNLSAATIGNPGANDMTGATIGSNSDPSGYIDGDVVEALVYNGTLPLATDVEAYFQAKYGSTWPQ